MVSAGFDGIRNEDDSLAQPSFADADDQELAEISNELVF